jgi:hypothetical protein
MDPTELADLIERAANHITVGASPGGRPAFVDEMNAAVADLRRLSGVRIVNLGPAPKSTPTFGKIAGFCAVAGCPDEADSDGRWCQAHSQLTGRNCPAHIEESVRRHVAAEEALAPGNGRLDDEEWKP